MGDYVTSTFQYLQWQKLYEKEKPFLLLRDVPPDAQDQRKNNLVFEDVEKVIRNTRDQKDSFTLDEHGFSYRIQYSKVASFSDQAYVDKVYLPEMEKLIKESVEGADKIFLFDWRIRRSHGSTGGNVSPSDEKPAASGRFDLNDLTAVLRPAAYPHVDQSPSAVISRTRLQLGDEAEMLLRGRVRVINTWRPIKNPVENWPLGVCDGSTVAEENLIETDHVRRGYVGATMYCLNAPEHQWYYLDHQRPEEVLLMKMFDSDETVKAKCRWSSPFDIHEKSSAYVRLSF